jgi:hypothetical protein
MRAELKGMAGGMLEDVVQEGDLAALIKRVPSVAGSRKSLAKALRAIRKMNPRIAKHALRSIRQEREKALRDWFAAMETDDAAADGLWGKLVRNLMSHFATPAGRHRVD